MRRDRCGEVRELLAAFFDDELPCDLSHGIQEHLDACEACGRFAKLEQGFTSALRDRVPRLEAPAAFAEEVRRRLKAPESLALERGAGRSRAPFFRLRAMSYAAAAAAVAAALLLPAAEMVWPGLMRSLAEPFTGVRTATGVLVCVECEKLGASLERQRHCHREGHRTGLRCPETGLWNLVANEASLPLLGEPENRGKLVTVEGRFLQDIRYIDARSLTVAAGI